MLIVFALKLRCSLAFVVTYYKDLVDDKLSFIAIELSICVYQFYTLSIFGVCTIRNIQRRFLSHSRKYTLVQHYNMNNVVKRFTNRYYLYGL